MIDLTTLVHAGAWLVQTAILAGLVTLVTLVVRAAWRAGKPRGRR